MKIYIAARNTMTEEGEKKISKNSDRRLLSFYYRNNSEMKKILRKTNIADKKKK